MIIDDIIEYTVKKEAGYVNHPLDKGGPTNWGITEKTARDNGYKGNMQDLTKQEAVRIYKQQYYTKPKLNLIAELSSQVAQEVFDTGVNMSPEIAIKFLQRALNLLNRNQRLYPDINVDGVIGSRTINNLKSFLKSRPNSVTLLVKVLNGLQFSNYVSIAERDQTQEEFIAGWVLNRVE